MLNCIIYEDNGYPGFYPLTHLRPVFDLRCGAFSTRERLAAMGFKARGYWVTNDRQPASRAAGCSPVNGFSGLKGASLLLNGRAFLTNDDLAVLVKCREDAAIISGQTVVAIKLHDEKRMAALAGLEPSEAALGNIAGECRRIEMNVPVFGHLWDMVDHNSRAIASDFQYFKGGGGKLAKGALLIGKKNQVKIGNGAQVDPGAVLDMRNGPIIIGRNARVRPRTYIEGPCYAGPESLVDGATLRPGCSIGEQCKIAGEVEASIILDYSNKHHDGFLGHAYLGSWVNLGALTTNSDLKNNYGPVSVWMDGKMVNTGSSKVGCFIGDHSKTAIGTLINTGTVIGVGCNIFGGPVRKFLSSFSWGNSEKFTEHKLDKMLETAETVMKRRKQVLSPAMRDLLTELYRNAKKTAD